MVCIHGLTTASYVWGRLLPALTQMGYRVLAYDHYGRGHSDAPWGLQDTEFFCSHLSDLLDHLGITTPVTLLGYSMGGAIATCFAAKHPDRTDEMILIAPAGMALDLGASARILPRLPLLGDWLFHMGFPKSYRKGIEDTRTADGAIDEIIALQLAEPGRRGFVPAVLSSLRGVLSAPLAAQHRALRGLRVTAIWGAQDRVIPLTSRDLLRDWNPNARHVTIPNAKHELTFSHPDEVAQAIRDRDYAG